MKKIFLLFFCLVISAFGTININTANEKELMSLPGIGEKKAAAIIEYRKEHKFSNIDDIKNVKGIGEKRFEKIKNLISTSGDNKIEDVKKEKNHNTKNSKKFHKDQNKTK